MQHKYSKASVIALLLGTAKAVEDGSNGLAGEAPCLQDYQVVFDWDVLGFDPHAVHGMLAADGGHVAVGKSLQSDGDESSSYSFIIKT